VAEPLVERRYRGSKNNPNSEIAGHTGACVIHLGGNPYRDGSYEYYLSEKVVTNDPKA